MLCLLTEQFAILKRTFLLSDTYRPTWIC